MKFNKLELENEQRDSVEIEKKLKKAVIDVLNANVVSMNLDVFKANVLKAKVGMEYLRDIDLNFRVRFAQKLKVITMLPCDKKEKEQLIEKAFKKKSKK